MESGDQKEIKSSEIGHCGSCLSFPVMEKGERGETECHIFYHSVPEESE